MNSLVQTLTQLMFIVVVVRARENARCRNTELCFFDTSSQPSTVDVDFYCNCNDSSTNCSWTRFAEPSVYIGNSDSPNEAVLLWNRSIGYGQYICLRDYLIEVKDVLILPGKGNKLMM